MRRIPKKLTRQSPALKTYLGVLQIQDRKVAGPGIRVCDEVGDVVGHVHERAVIRHKRTVLSQKPG